jgi:pilus assembly protein Flp/PilA
MSTKLQIMARQAKQKGLTTVEYAVAGGLIAAAVATAFSLLGIKVTSIITAITAAL